MRGSRKYGKEGSDVRCGLEMSSREGAVVDCAVAPWYLQGIALPFAMSQAHFQFSKSVVILLAQTLGISCCVSQCWIFFI